MSTKRRCPHCRRKKGTAQWSKCKTIPYCKKCWREASARYRETHREVTRATNRKCWDKNKDDYNLNRKPGGRSIYETLFSEQKGLCAICHNPETSQRYKTLTVDHCHKTNGVRGLLCSNCNRALGMFRESPEILKSTIKYLKRYENRISVLGVPVQPRRPIRESRTMDSSQQGSSETHDFGLVRVQSNLPHPPNRRGIGWNITSGMGFLGGV